MVPVTVAARQPVFIWGGPGVGKSAVVRQLAEALKITLQDVRALLLDPVDLRGLPFLGSDGRSKWATPEFLPQNGSGTLFLDELNAAPGIRSFYIFHARGQLRPGGPTESSPRSLLTRRARAQEGVKKPTGTVIPSGATRRPKAPGRSLSPTALVVSKPRERNVGTVRRGKSNRAATR